MTISIGKFIQCGVAGLLENNELERMWKEAMVVSKMLCICLEGQSKANKRLSHDIRSPGRDLNPGFPEYEARWFKNSFTYLKEYTNLYRRHTQRFEQS
jgi:hypothetical protein